MGYSSQQQAEEIGKVCLDDGAINIYFAGSEKVRSDLMEFRGKFCHALKQFGILEIADVTVPRSKIAELVETVKSISEEYDIGVITVGHAGDGNVHLSVMNKEGEGVKLKAKEIITRVFQAGASLGGTISGEHGLGFAKKDYLYIAADTGEIELMKRIKKAFDPNGIMNPGKVFDL